VQRYNFFRPLLILLVAFAVNNLVTLLCNGMGVAPETTESIALIAMVLAALLTYVRLTRNRRKK